MKLKMYLISAAEVATGHIFYLYALFLDPHFHSVKAAKVFHRFF